MTAVADPTVTEATATTAAPAVEEAPIDLTKFNDAVSDAISDGAPSAEEIKNVRRVYGELEPRKGKSAARAKLDDDVRDAIQGSNITQAQALLAIKDAILKSGGLSGKRTAAPKNPTEAHTSNVLAIQIGYSLAYSNVPEGVDPNWIDLVKATPELEASAQSYRKWLSDGQEGDEPEVPEAAKAGARISLGKAPKGQGRKPGKDKAESNPADGALAGAPTGTAPDAVNEAPAAPEGWEQ